MKRATIKVKGTVQGVFFRQGIKTKAQELDLTGWVRNEKDGSVTVIAEGKEDRLNELVDWARRGGSSARIKSVELDMQDATDEFGSFRIMY